jgi:hypothetical protein
MMDAVDGVDRIRGGSRGCPRGLRGLRSASAAGRRRLPSRWLGSRRGGRLCRLPGRALRSRGSRRAGRPWRRNHHSRTRSLSLLRRLPPGKVGDQDQREYYQEDYYRCSPEGSFARMLFTMDHIRTHIAPRKY